MRQPNQEFGGWFWTNLRIYTPWKAISVLTACATLVVGCGREGAIARSFHFAGLVGEGATNSGVLARQHTERTAADLRASLRTASLSSRPSAVSMGRAVVRYATSAEDKLRRDIRRHAARSSADQINSAERDAIRLRDLIRSFSRAVDRYEHASPQAIPRAARALDRQLDRLFPRPREHTFSNQSGGVQQAQPLENKPILNTAITPAYGSPMSSSSPSTLPTTPTSEDLEVTAEADRSSAIRELSESLGNDPVRIFNYVRQTIKFEPYYGVRKGATGTLLERSGNDADQAALAVALLRAAGVPARFVQGTAELSVGAAASWLALPDSMALRPEAIADVLASGGYPVVQRKVNQAVQALRIDRVWLEAYVPDASYRGVDETLGTKRWLPLDPSTKRYVRAADELASDDTDSPLTGVVKQFADASSSSTSEGRVTPAWSDLLETAKAALPEPDPDSANPESPLDLDGVRIALGAPSVLPASLPFRATTVSDERTALPQSFFARVRIQIDGVDSGGAPNPADQSDIDVTVKALNAAYGRLTIGYAPATPGDEDVLNASGGVAGASAPLVDLLPVVKLNGALLSAGAVPIGLGYSQRLRVTYLSPGFAASTAENSVVAGGLTVLAVDVGLKSTTSVRDRAKRVDALAATTTTQNALGDERLGEMLALAGDAYFLRNDLFNAGLAAASEVYAQRALSGALVGLSMSTTTLAGFPLRVDADGLLMDVDEDVQAITELSGEAESPAYLDSSASFASVSEGAALSMAFADADPGISTTRILAEAAKAGTPVYEVTAANQADVLSLVEASEVVKRDVRRAVAGGALVRIPARAPVIEGWTGTGYVIVTESSREFRISGGASGGFKPRLFGALGAAYIVISLVNLAQFIVKLIKDGYEDPVACGVYVFTQLLKSAIELALSVVLRALFLGPAFGPLFAMLILLALAVVLLYLISKAEGETEDQCLGNP